MPTGYTAGIIDGEITTFQQFAKQCMRNFGATIHMRDDKHDAEYKPRVPSDYYLKEIEKDKKKIKEANELSDKQLIARRKKQLNERKVYHTESIQKCKATLKVLQDMQIEIGKWNPPTPEHEGIKKFMAEQVQKTIEADCDTKYHDSGIIDADVELLSINADQIRQNMFMDGKKDLEYHTKSYNEEVKRCEESNRWVTDLINSLPK